MAILLAACSESSAPTTKSTPDGGTPDAAPNDGGTTQQDQQAGPSYCATLDPPPFLCVDFDDGAAPADVFTRVEGAAVEDKALRAQSNGTTESWVEHQTDPAPQWSVVKLGFSVRVDDQAADARTIIAHVGQHMTDSECPVELELTPSGLTLKGGAADAKLTKTVAKGKAARIVITQQAGTDGGKITASVTVDGQPALAAPVELACTAFPGPPRVVLGRISGAGASDLRFDDVVFDGR